MQAIVLKSENWCEQEKKAFEELHHLIFEPFESDEHKNTALTPENNPAFQPDMVIKCLERIKKDQELINYQKQALDYFQNNIYYLQQENNYLNEAQRSLMVQRGQIGSLSSELQTDQDSNCKEPVANPTVEANKELEITEQYQKASLSTNARLFEDDEPCDIDYLHGNLNNVLEDLLKSLSSENSISEEDSHWDYTTQTPTQDQIIIRKIETGERKIKNITSSTRVRVIEQDCKASSTQKAFSKEYNQDSIETDGINDKEKPKKTRFARRVHTENEEAQSLENDKVTTNIVDDLPKRAEETLAQKVDHYINKELNGAKNNTKFSIFPFVSYIIGFTR